jgi:hypothetical protein
MRYLPSSHLVSRATRYRLAVVFPDGSPCGRAPESGATRLTQRKTPGAHSPEYRAPLAPSRERYPTPQDRLAARCDRV